jgi:hypothetical protein
MGGECRIALGPDDRAVLADYVSLEPELLAGEIAGCEANLAELRDGVERLRRLLLLYEVIECGEALVSEEDAPSLLDYLWREAQGTYDHAHYELEQIPKMRVDADHRSCDSLGESEEVAREGAAEAEHEAEVCARLIEQLSGGGDE